MVPFLLLLLAVAAAWFVHVRWGKADRRSVERQPEQETWADISEREASERDRDEIVSNAARRHANRHFMN